MLRTAVPPAPAPAGWPALRQALWRASRVKLAVLFVLSCWSVGLAVGGSPGARAEAGDLAVLVPHPSAGEVFVQSHHCWRGPAPSPDAVPGHAVIGRSSGPVRYVGRHGARLALEQVFEGRPHGLRVYAFCR